MEKVFNLFRLSIPFKCYYRKGIYEVFSKTTDFQLGLQPNRIGDTLVFVMPSSSARCSNLPRATDKLPFYIGTTLFTTLLTSTT